MEGEEEEEHAGHGGPELQRTGRSTDVKNYVAVLFEVVCVNYRFSTLKV